MCVVLQVLRVCARSVGEARAIVIAASGVSGQIEVEPRVKSMSLVVTSWK